MQMERLIFDLCLQILLGSLFSANLLHSLVRIGMWNIMDDAVCVCAIAFFSSLIFESIFDFTSICHLSTDICGRYSQTILKGCQFNYLIQPPTQVFDSSFQCNSLADSTTESLFALF